MATTLRSIYGTGTVKGDTDNGEIDERKDDGLRPTSEARKKEIG